MLTTTTATAFAPIRPFAYPNPNVNPLAATPAQQSSATAGDTFTPSAKKTENRSGCNALFDWVRFTTEGLPKMEALLSGNIKLVPVSADIKKGLQRYKIFASALSNPRGKGDALFAHSISVEGKELGLFLPKSKPDDEEGFIHSIVPKNTSVISTSVGYGVAHLNQERRYSTHSEALRNFSSPVYEQNVPSTIIYPPKKNAFVENKEELSSYERLLALQLWARQEANQSVPVTDMAKVFSASDGLIGKIISKLEASATN